ncbi:MAG: hypothetical protein RIB84_10530 [Sneathiellaceae bacterium]
MSTAADDSSDGDQGAGTPDAGQPVAAQLLLHLPAAVAAGLGAGAAGLLQRLAPACLIVGTADGRLDHRLAEAAHAEGIPVLLEITDEAPHRVGADGVYLRDAGLGPAEIADWRRALGPNGMLVAYCGGSRHAAMEAADAGADAVAFAGSEDEVAELIGWWAPLMEVPCIAAWIGSADLAIRLARAGADFILPDPQVWDRGADAMAGFAAALAKNDS